MTNLAHLVLEDNRDGGVWHEGIEVGAGPETPSDERVAGLGAEDVKT